MVNKKPRSYEIPHSSINTDNSNNNLFSNKPVVKRLKFFNRYPENWHQSEFKELVHSYSSSSLNNTISDIEPQSISVSESVSNNNHQTTSRDPIPYHSLFDASISQPLTQTSIPTEIPPYMTTQAQINLINTNKSYDQFRKELEAIVGPLDDAKFIELRDRSSGNVNAAVNFLFDNSTNNIDSQPQHTCSPILEGSDIPISQPCNSTEQPLTQPSDKTREQEHVYQDWNIRYVGSVQAEILVTRSGSNLVTYGEKLAIKSGVARKAPKGKGRKASTAQQDHIQYVENSKGLEIGKFLGDFSNMISTLANTDVAEFQATVIFADSFLRTGDTFYIQLNCFLKKSAFDLSIYNSLNTQTSLRSRESPGQINSAYDAGYTGAAVFNRKRNLDFRSADKTSSFHGFNNTNESPDEHLEKRKQQSLVSLFRYLALEPIYKHASRKNSPIDQIDKSKFLEQLEKAAEINLSQSATKETIESGDNNDENDDSMTDEQLVDQQQLDTVYGRTSEAQYAKLKEMDPPETFKMELRPYQKKGLSWMVQRESEDTYIGDVADMDENGIVIEPMHPLWQEFEWPEIPSEFDLDRKNIEDYAGDSVPYGPAQFYANLYSGEMSLKFPRQKKAARGGILADEMGLGKTISTMALIHAGLDEQQKERQNEKTAQFQNIVRDMESNPDYAQSTTLIVTPMSLLSQWESEAYAASKSGTLRVLVYYGASVSNVTGGKDLKWLLCGPGAKERAPHIIITTYGVVASEHGTLKKFYETQKSGISQHTFTIKKQKTKSGGDNTSHNTHIWEDTRKDHDYVYGLYGVEFHRIVLDEGHVIKNRNTITAKACYDLRAQRRWILTGTPIVNRLEDLYSLVKFLKAEPWNNFSFWKTFITVPFQNKEVSQALKVVQSVMEPLLLRRTKNMKQPDGLPLVELPEKQTEIVKVAFSQQEKEIYDVIYAAARSKFDVTLDRGTVMKSYTVILSQILRLRQACCHPALVTKALMAENKLTSQRDANYGPDGLDGMESVVDLVAKFNSTSGDDVVSNEQRNSALSGSQSATKFGFSVLEDIQNGKKHGCVICMEEEIPEDEQAVTECMHITCTDCLISHIEVSF